MARIHELIEKWNLNDSKREKIKEIFEEFISKEQFFSIKINDDFIMILCHKK